MSVNGTPSSKPQTNLILDPYGDPFQQNKTQIVDATVRFELGMTKLNEKLQKLEGDKKVHGDEIIALKVAVVADKAHLTGVIGNAKTASDGVREDNGKLKGENTALSDAATKMRQQLHDLKLYIETERKKNSRDHKSS